MGVERGSEKFKGGAKRGLKRELKGLLGDPGGSEEFEGIKGIFLGIQGEI